jgi:hypothetical protein
VGLEVPVATTSFISWDGDPTVFVKDGSKAKAVRLSLDGSWVKVDPSAVWFDEARNVVALTEAEFASAAAPAAPDRALKLLEKSSWKELLRPSTTDE